MITDILPAIAIKERGTVKGREISKLVRISRENVKFSDADCDIEVISINAIENGVEVFARAWNVNGQIGFGQDGTIDIERFVIINPPILINDPNGNIVREWIDANTGAIKKFTYREDLKTALLQVLAHAIFVKKQKFGSSKIVFGKTGRTTLTVFPDAGTGGTTVDGRVYRGGQAEIFSVIVAGAGTNADELTTVTTTGCILVSHLDTTNLWKAVIRMPTLFNTSSIGANSAITSGTYSIDIVDAATNTSVSVNVTEINPAANNNLIPADFQTVTNTKLATDILVSNMTFGVYTTWTLNASGLAAINKTGITKFCLRIAEEITATSPTWIANTQYGLNNIKTADGAGTASDPKLVVEFSPALVLTEAIIIVDSLLKRGQKVFPEIIAIVDSIINIKGKILSEAVILADSAAKQTTKILTDVITVIDTLARQSQKVLSEVVSIVDTLGRSTGKTLAEALVVVDSVARQTQRVFTEVVLVADTLIRQAGKVLGEAVTIVDSFTRTITAFRVFTETVVIVDTLARQAGKVLSETVLIADTLARILVKVILESIIIADSAFKQSGKTLGEAITIVDSLARNSTKIFAEAVVVVDSASKSAVKVFSEIVGVIDSLSAEHFVPLFKAVIRGLYGFSTKLNQEARTFVLKIKQ